MKAINTEKAPAAIGPYSQAIRTGNIVFVSGQLPIDPLTGNFAGEDIKSQTRQSLTNIQNILKEAGHPNVRFTLSYMGYGHGIWAYVYDAQHPEFMEWLFAQ